MLLVELTINNTLYRISNEELPLTHLWRHYIDNGFTSPSYRTRTDHGGFCELTFGSLPLLPSLFEDSNVWPPPIQCRCTVYYTVLLESAKTEMFSGYAHLKSYDRESVIYDLYTDIPAVPLLEETIDYNSDTVPIPYVFGAVSHINPLRLADDENDYPVYCLSGLSTNPAKYGSAIYNANKGTDPIPVGDAFIDCVAHGFETGDDITIEGFGDYDGTYTIVDNSDDIIDLDTPFINLPQYLCRFTGSASAGSILPKIGDAPCAGGALSYTLVGPTNNVYIYNQGPGYFRFYKDASFVGTITSIKLIESLSGVAVGEYFIDTDCTNSYLFSLGTGWSVTSSGLVASAGTASYATVISHLFNSYNGQLFKPGQTCLYDDGYPIPENLEAIDTETFTLNANPVGELTASGVNPDITDLDELIEWACHEDRLCCSYDTTLSRSPSPVVNYLANSQGVLLDTLSDICAYNTHLFYLSKDSDISKTINLSTTSYSWTASISGTNEYYLRKSDDSNPYKPRPDNFVINTATASEGVVGSLEIDTWAYGDNDSLGYETIYVRLSDGTDPDSKVDNYIQAIYNTVLYLVALENSNGTRTLTEFDFFRASYEILPPVKSLSSDWQMRDAVEDTSGIYVKTSDLSEKVLNYSYGNEDSITPYDYTKATIKTRLETIRIYLNKPIVSLSMPIYGTTLPLPGEKITLPDTSLVANTISEIYVRSIQYDFDNDEFQITGEGIVSEDT